MQLVLDPAALILLPHGLLSGGPVRNESATPTLRQLGGGSLLPAVQTWPTGHGASMTPGQDADLPLCPHASVLEG
eukprot:1905073-Amphidinium_carterae.2